MALRRCLEWRATLSNEVWNKSCRAALAVLTNGPLKDRFLQPIDQPNVCRTFPDFEVVGKGDGLQKQPIRQDRFAVIQFGSHQFKVTSEDKIYIEKVRKLAVNSEIHFKKVMVWADRDDTVIGRPYIQGAYVKGLVEEQCKDATLMIFKKKRRKNYRRLKYHTQDLTGVRILKICDMDAMLHPEAQKEIEPSASEDKETKRREEERQLSIELQKGTEPGKEAGQFSIESQIETEPRKKEELSAETQVETDPGREGVPIGSQKGTESLSPEEQKKTKALSLESEKGTTS